MKFRNHEVVNNNTLTTDFLIIGSGVAGLNAALHAKQFGEVTLITKSSLEVSSSYWAQGGIAAVLNNEDSYQSHREDTLDAGRGLCNSKAVDILVEDGARLVKDLIDQGMSFDSKNGNLELSLEGGHSHRRVLHANGAATGKVLVEFLADRAVSQSNIQIIEHAFAYRLLTDEGKCSGADAFLYKEDRILSIQSPVTILATGGYSGLYQRSTNPHTSTGDGLWLGYNAGAMLQDLELIQFHPTAFYSEDGSTFLISEAVRGEGAHLYNEDGERFLKDHPQRELAPRDIVSQAIFEQIQQQNSNFVYLDLRHLNTDNLRDLFPGLIHRIEEQGIDIKTDLIPIAPAAHYCIGGVATDLDAQTSLKGLYACGEVAATGVHGANRLASNSLLECLVFSERAIDHAVQSKLSVSSGGISSNFKINWEEETSFIQLQGGISETLSRHVGIQREEKELNNALQTVKSLRNKISNSHNEYFALRSRGMVDIAELIINSALQREESRGVHMREDFPEPERGKDHISFVKENRQVAISQFGHE